jgi:hypothetical protein
MPVSVLRMLRAVATGCPQRALELELELIQAHVTQFAELLRVEVGACALREEGGVRHATLRAAAGGTYKRARRKCGGGYPCRRTAMRPH